MATVIGNQLASIRLCPFLTIRSIKIVQFEKKHRCPGNISKTKPPITQNGGSMDHIFGSYLFQGYGWMQFGILNHP